MYDRKVWLGLVPGLDLLMTPSSSAEADSTFDQDWVQHLARQITDFLQANLVWIGLQPKKPLKGSEFPDEVVTMLDYACGDGVASRVSD